MGDALRLRDVLVPLTVPLEVAGADLMVVLVGLPFAGEFLGTDESWPMTGPLAAAVTDVGAIGGLEEGVVRLDVALELRFAPAALEVGAAISGSGSLDFLVFLVPLRSDGAAGPKSEFSLRFPLALALD